MKAESGETTASINRRRDAEEEPRVMAALRAGATLVRAAALDRYYVDRGGMPGGGSLSPGHVRRLELAGQVELIGVHRYALTKKGAA